MSTRRAGCGESRTSGSEGGPRRRAGGNVGTAPRSDPYAYLPTRAGFLYLAVVLDACTRRVVGWAMADHMRAELVVDALDLALWNRRPAAGPVHHSDSENVGAGCSWAA
jgi:putative transposase